jgi:tetratricopeptide (TPR) repeat protein
MTEVLLSDYLERMRTHLHEGQYADVMSLGQHVLRYYPKDIEAYRLLAEASLETNDLNAAKDLFQRVRSADPENIIALVGLSIVHEQHKELDEAIWHLERAFEIQSANAELRKELLRLYAEYEGAPRDRLKLSPGGLARLYARQGLYSQAIQEFRTLLRRDPTRSDIQAALAEVLYRVGRKQESAEVAQALLEKLPYCLKANLLLGALWSENGVPEAETLLQRAHSLDPEHKVARGLLPDHWDDAPPPMLPAMGAEVTTSVSTDTPPTPTLDESAGRDVSLIESLTPAAEPADKTEAPSAPSSAAESLIAAVTEPQPPVEQAAPVMPVAPIEPKPEPQKPTAEPVKEQPVNLPSVQLTEEKPQPSLAPAESPSQLKVEGEPKPARRMQPSLPQIGPTIPGALDKLPAWVRGAAPSTMRGAPSASSGSTEESHPIVADRLSAARLSHLEKARPARESPAAFTRIPASPEPQSTELPEWLTRARRAARSGEVEENIAAPSAPEGNPAWLTGANTESPPTAAAATSPQWLRADSTNAPSSQARADAEDTLPAWLAASEPEDQAATSATGTVLPEWLTGRKPEAEPPAAEASTSVPAWLKPSETEAPADALARGTPSPELPKAPSSASVEPQAALPKVETPAWLAQHEPEAAAPEKEAEETIPEWLREISASTEAEQVAASTVQTPPGEPSTPQAASASMMESEPTAETSAAPPAPEPVRTEPSAPVAESAAAALVAEKPEAESDSPLAQARGLWTSGDRAGAIELYEKALQKGPSLTAEVIADFEEFAQEPDASIPTHRLLGDAYSVAGRYKEALEQYRIVMGK